MSDNSSKTKELFFDLTMSDDSNQLKKDEIAQAEKQFDEVTVTEEIIEEVVDVTESVAKTGDVLPELKKGVRETTLDLTGELDLTSLLQPTESNEGKTQQVIEDVRSFAEKRETVENETTSFDEQKASLDVDQILANLEKNLETIESLSTTDVKESDADLGLTNPFLTTETLLDDLETTELSPDPVVETEGIKDNFIEKEESVKVEQELEMNAMVSEEKVDELDATIVEKSNEETQEDTSSVVSALDLEMDFIENAAQIDDVIAENSNEDIDNEVTLNDDTIKESESFVVATVEDDETITVEKDMEIEVVQGSSQISNIPMSDESIENAESELSDEENETFNVAAVTAAEEINIDTANDTEMTEKVSDYHPKSVFEELELDENIIEEPNIDVDTELELEEATTLDALLERLTKITELELENFSENSTLPKNKTNQLNESFEKQTDENQTDENQTLSESIIDLDELVVESEISTLDSAESIKTKNENTEAISQLVDEEVVPESNDEESKEVELPTVEFTSSLQELESLMEDVDNLTAKIHEKDSNTTLDSAVIESEEQQTTEINTEKVATATSSIEDVLDDVLSFEQLNEEKITAPSFDEIPMIDSKEKPSIDITPLDFEKEAKSVHPVNRGALEINLEQSVDLLNIPSIELSDKVEEVSVPVKEIVTDEVLEEQEVTAPNMFVDENGLSASDLILLDSDIDDLSLTQPLVFSEPITSIEVEKVGNDEKLEQIDDTKGLEETESMQLENDALASLVASLTTENEEKSPVKDLYENSSEYAIKEEIFTRTETDVTMYDELDLVDVDTKEFLREQFSEMTATLELEDLNEQIAEAKEQLSELQAESDDDIKEQRINGLMILTKLLIAVLIILIPISLKIIFTSSSTFDAILNHQFLYPVLIGIIILMFIPDVIRVIKGSK